MNQVSVTRNCIRDIFTGKPLETPVCVLLSPKPPSDCFKPHTTSFFLSDGNVWGCGELDWDIRETKLTTSNGQLLVRLVNFEVDWPCTVVTDHPVIIVKEIEVLSGINDPTFFRNLTMNHHIYASVTKPLFPMFNGILPFILGFNVSSNVGTIKPIVIQPVTELKQGTMTFYWISDGEFCCHAKFGNQGEEVKVYDLYQVLKWQIFVDVNGRRKLIIIDYKHYKPFKHVLYHYSLGCKPFIRDVKSVLSSTDDVSSNCKLTSGFVETLFKLGNEATMMVVNDKYKHPILQVLLHAQVDSYMYGFVSDGNHIWGAVFVNPVKRGAMKRNMIIKVDYYEILLLPKWRKYHSLCIHDWSAVEHSSSTIGSPELVYKKFEQPHLQFVLDKILSVPKPMVQVSKIKIGKCQIFDGSCATTGVFCERDVTLRDCEIIRMTNFKWIDKCSVQIIECESISCGFLPLSDN